MLALPLLLGLAQLAPHHGPGLAFRLAAAAACVLFVPGALILRVTGWPEEIGVALAGALCWSLAALFGALLVTFAFAGSLTLTLLLVAALVLAALVPAAMRSPSELVRADALTVVAVVAAGAGFAVALWYASRPAAGDALFHLARVRKLDAFHHLSSLSVVDEFRHGGLHPGYAFPLWHGALALVSRLGGVDPAQVIRYLPAILAPVAFVLAYGAGRALFRSTWGGAAALLAQATQFALPAGKTSPYKSLALPGTAARQLLVTALLALVFAYVAKRSASLLGAVGVGGLVLALVHPTYAVFLAILLGGFLLARGLLAQADSSRIGTTLVTLLVPLAGVAFWLLPLVKKTSSYHAGAGELHRTMRHYAGQLDVFSLHSYRLSPELFASGGAVVVAGLVLVPLAGLVAQRRWAAYVLGGSSVIFALTLIPFIFPRFADLVSISQARREGAFLPLAFALAGGAAVLARLVSWALLPLALAAGIALQLAFPGDFSYHLTHGGPAIATWIAAVGGAAALLAGMYFGGRLRIERQGAVALLSVALFVTPVAATGLSHLLDRSARSQAALPSGLVRALRQVVPAGATVFSDDVTAYAITAYAPVYVNAAPPAHVADTTDNRRFARRADARLFMRTGDLSIVRRYDAQWIVVRRARYTLHLQLPRVYQDGQYVLYRVAPAGVGATTIHVHSGSQFQAAVTKLRHASGTIVLLPHVYRQKLVIPARSGGRLYVLGSPGAHVQRVLLSRTSLVTLDGFTVSPQGQNAWVRIRASHHVALRHLVVTARGTSHSAVVQIPNSSGVVISKSTFTHCGDRSPAWVYCILLRRHASHVVIAGNWFHDCYGCDFVHGRFGSDLTLRSNVLERALPCRLDGERTRRSLPKRAHERCSHQDLVELFGGDGLRVQNNHFGVYEAGGAQLNLSGAFDHVAIANNVFVGTDRQVQGYRSRVGVLLGGRASREVARYVRIVNNTILTGARRLDGYVGSIYLSPRYRRIPLRERPVIANNVIGNLQTPHRVCRGAKVTVSNVVLRGAGCSASDRVGAANLDELGRPTLGSGLLLGRGSRRYAPGRDVAGHRRVRVDVGAYQYVPGK